MPRRWFNIGSIVRRSLLGQDCLLCGAASADALLCDGCNADLPWLGEACPQCAGPRTGAALCGACLTRPPQFEVTLAVWQYEFPVDRLVRALKYGRFVKPGAALRVEVAVHKELDDGSWELKGEAFVMEPDGAGPTQSSQTSGTAVSGRFVLRPARVE